jgi:myosin heavy subunit
MMNNLCAAQLQACWRQRDAMKKYQALRSKFILLQAVVRGQQSRSKTAESMCTDAALVLQTFWRRHLALIEYQRARDAAVLLQSVMRSYQRREHHQQGDVNTISNVLAPAS